jgi:general nucleoside transport system ATP-binding protein
MQGYNAPENKNMELTVAPAIELIGIDKKFGQVHANKNIHLKIAKGSIHGVIGENGAGKSTLMSILYGFYAADSGEIRIDGKRVTIHSSQDAIKSGIGMVHQHFMLVENFTVLENIMLSGQGGALLRASEAATRTILKKLATDYELEVDPDALIQDLPVGLQQRVEIIKALTRGARTLILDEPTGVLTPAEAGHLFRILRQLRDQGKTILLITHKLREIMAVTDSVSVMRRGEMVSTLKTKQTSPGQLAELMVGRRVLLEVDKAPAKPGAGRLRVEGLTFKDERGCTRLDDVSFTVHDGEILGIAGVSGNGQSELLAVLAGIQKAVGGKLVLSGEKIDPVIEADPAKMRMRGVAHVPEDRHHMGLVLPFEESENSILGYHRAPQYGSGFSLDPRKIRLDAVTKIKKFDIRPDNCRLKTASFSGGNQQKIVLAREMERDPRLLLVGQPTRGVDIGAIEFIHKQLITMRDAGKAILLVSVELDEIRSLSDRVLVMFAGRIVGEVSPQADEAEIGLLMAGINRNEAVL